MGGVVAGRSEQMKEVVGFLRLQAPPQPVQRLDFPSRAWKPLGLRMKAHCANAQALAEWLSSRMASRKCITPASRAIHNMTWPCVSNVVSARW